MLVIFETDVKTSAGVNDVKRSHHLIKLLMVIVFQLNRETVYKDIIDLQCNSSYG